jgi:hypothetical protein
MLGRKDYTPEEIAGGKAAVKAQLAAWKKVASAADEAAEATFFNNMVLVLDRWYVHRVRPVVGKDTNPLTEVELLVDSIRDQGGVFTTNKVIKYVPDQSVLGLEAGDTIALTAKDFDELAKAFFAELEARFLP